MILRYFCTISPLSFIRISVLYGAFLGCSSWRSPVSEKTPQTLALRQAAAKISVSSPGTLAAVSNISLASYMMPWVLYSGKMTRSMPGKPIFMPTIISAILPAFAEDLGLGVQARHLVVDDGDADGVVAAADITVKHVDLLSSVGGAGGRCVIRARQTQKTRASTSVVVAGASLPRDCRAAPLPRAPVAGRELDAIRERHGSQR